MFALPAFAADSASEGGIEASRHDVHLAPGQSYNASNASSNTTVYIEQSGTYTLSGTSSKVRFVVKSTDARIYLFDGLNIDPGWLANVGQATPALIAEDQGGTVTLVSKAHANIAFGGYLRSAAIQKTGTNTRLVFDTENPSDPGTITATRSSSSASPGIGSSRGYSLRPSGTVGNIEFNGGRVVSSGGFDAAGIGGSNRVNVDGITINGGTVTARGGWGGAGIGSGSGGRTAQIAVNGGTVTAMGGSGAAGIGGAKDCDAKSISLNGGIVNAQGESAGIGGAAARTHVPALSVKGMSTPFGTKDLYTDPFGDMPDTLYLHLPEKAYVSSARDEKGMVYVGEVHANSAGMLKKGNNITLDANVEEGYDGSARAEVGSTSLANIDAPENFDERAQLVGYASAPSGGRMAVNDLNQFILGNPWVDDLGRWTYAGEPLTLYAVWRLVYYGISYHANTPAQASTQPVGEMPDDSVPVGEEFPLKPNGYSLPGYRFAGWNTEPDGSGTHYADEQTALNLAGEDRAVAHLYAQWEPLPYTVTLDAGGGSSAGGSTIAVEMTFDQEANLPANPFTHEDRTFAGWRDETTGELLSDQAVACNLCTLDESGEPQGTTLTAQWTAHDEVAVTVAVDGEPFELDSPSSGIALVPLAGGDAVRGFEKSGAGIYVVRNVKPGVYGVDVEGLSTGNVTVEVAEEESVVIPLDYFTVRVHAENEHIGAWLGAAGVTERTVLKGEALSLGAQPAEGYAFDSYTAMGVLPETEGSDTWNPAAQDQRIVVSGEVDITAHPEPIVYCVSFDPNGGEGAVAAQDMVFDQPQNLFAATFSRTGYAFAGWNEKPDGTGASYADKERVENLADAEGAHVTLYAQWEPIAYTVAFRANGASGTMEPQEMRYDEAAALSTCAFSYDGYRFAGWNTHPGGLGDAYDDKETVANLASDEGAVVELWAQWEREAYLVQFDANGGTGSMPDSSVWTRAPWIVPSASFERAGYSFAGWNSAPDGSGTSFAEGESTSGLSSADGGTATLYAQWIPLTYTVSFDGGGGEGDMPAQTMTFDESTILDAMSFSNGENAFIGWSVKGTAGSSLLYADGARVENLCSIEDDGTLLGYDLIAQWSRNDEVVVSITLDYKGLALENPHSDIVLTPVCGGRPVTGFTGAEGIYAISDVEPGTYIASVEGCPTTDMRVTVEAGRGSVVSLPFFTVNARGEDEHSTACLRAEEPEEEEARDVAQLGETANSESGEPVVELVAFDGSTLTLSAETAQGYAFAGYAASGVEPDSNGTGA